MPVISFGERPDQIWGGAGWALRQAIKDLRPYAAGNEAFLAKLERAEDYGNLGVGRFDPRLRRIAVAAIKEMCLGVLDGTRPSTIVESLPGDTVAHEQYYEAINELLAMAEAAERAFCREGDGSAKAEPN